MSVHGYYSAKQHQDNLIAYEYEGSDGKTVLLSEVSPYKRTGEQLTEFFQDNSYMGEFTKFIKKVELPGYQDKMRRF